MTDSPGAEAREPFRVAFVPGVTPDRWARVWAERLPGSPLELRPVAEDAQTAVLHDGRADMCFVRLPVDRDGLHVIPLYDEVPVVVVAKGHFVEAADEVTLADLADEHLVQDPDTVPGWRDVATEIRDGSRVDVPRITTRQAVETVAAGVGIVIVPLSVARLHHRKDVVHRPVADLPLVPVGLAWPVDSEDDRTETFIGIVRGRTARSSREPRSDAQQAASTRSAKPQGRRVERGDQPRKRGAQPGARRGQSGGRGVEPGRRGTTGRRRKGR
jgi:DNA-binding transcriptional LysR family regulator